MTTGARHRPSDRVQTHDPASGERKRTHVGAPSLRTAACVFIAYYVGAQNFVGLMPGYFAFYAGTEPSRAEKVHGEFLAEIENLRTHGLSAEELQRAKAKVIGHRKISRQDLGTHAMTSALDELYGLGYAYSDTEDALFEAVTLEEVREAARRYLTPDAYVLSLVGTF